MWQRKVDDFQDSEYNIGTKKDFFLVTGHEA